MKNLTLLRKALCSNYITNINLPLSLSPPTGISSYQWSLEKESDSPKNMINQQQQLVKANQDVGVRLSPNTTDLPSPGLLGELGASMHFRFFIMAPASFLSAWTFGKKPNACDSSFCRVTHGSWGHSGLPIIQLPKATSSALQVRVDILLGSLKNLAKGEKVVLCIQLLLDLGSNQGAK